MTDSLTLALAQINVTVGDIRGNARRIIDAVAQAAAQGADLVLFPEMAITGYPPEDLVFKSVFQQAAREALTAIIESSAAHDTAIVTGGLWAEGGRIYNSAFLIDRGKLVHIQHKRALPNYGVFDEKRLFTKGAEPDVVIWRGVKLGILVCEDVWDPLWPKRLGGQGAEMLLVINASPYETGKAQERLKVIAQAAQGAQAPVIYLNLIGGQDELVFDGRSFLVDARGEVAGRLAGFAEELALTRWERRGTWQCMAAPHAEWGGDLETIYRAMVLGLRDYVTKNKFNGVVIGLSGGIDSGLTAAVAVDALGPAMVRGLLMPSKYTSVDSMEDATALARNLGIATDTIPIGPAMEVFDAMLKPVFAGRQEDATEENIQARIRGNLLMAYSNKLGYMVVTTGNKSEMSVGYATLYGDMCGGYSVLKDVYKTTVWKLSRWRNDQGSGFGIQDSGVEDVTPAHAGVRMPSCDGMTMRETYSDAIIPERMITKPPTAELRYNQKDEDSLPPYEVLDAILIGLIEERCSIADLVARGFDRATVEQVAKMIYVAEYKRRQSPPGVKVTGMSFGRDRRYPITNQWIWQR